MDNVDQNRVVAVDSKKDICLWPIGRGRCRPVFLVETGEGRTPRPEDTPLGYTTGLSGI